MFAYVSDCSRAATTMVTSPSKRLASASPDALRHPKRPATSSPEEGELDDPSPPQPVHSSLPPKPQPLAKSKVPFPFKKKGESSVNGSVESNDPDGRFSRDAESRRRQGRGPSRPSMVADHWEPPYNTASARFYPQQRWESYPPRDHRDHRDHRPRSRARSPPPPSSYSPRSRSHSGSPSGHREKHRLPAHRPVPRDVSLSPPRARDRGRDADRDRDRHGDREDRERERDRRYRDDNDDRHYYPDDYDRRDYRRVDDRRARRESDHDYERSFRYEDRDRGRRMNSYRPSPHRYPPPSPLPPHSPPRTQPPLSTQPPSSPPAVPPPPHSPSTQPTENGQIVGTPPPPVQSPPPAPPPDERLLPKNDMLPESHAHVAIPMKRPGAPKDIHSPPSILQHAPAADKDKEKDKGELRVRPVRTREVVGRSRKEEMEAYGRAFTGCGGKSDYEVTTKLGEGTFG